MRCFQSSRIGLCQLFRLHTRQSHAQSLGRLRAANRFAVLSAYHRCHRSIVDVWLARSAGLGAGCRKQGQSAGQRRVPGTCNAGEQGRRARSPPDRASRRGQARYGGYSRQELPPLRLSGDPRHGIRWADVRRQPLSGADLAGFSGRDADRPPGKRPVGPDNSGLLQSAIHAEGRDGSDLPGANDLIAVEPSRSRCPRQSERQCRQRPAAHPGRHVQHLHLQYSDEYAAGSVLVSQPPARPHRGANLPGPCRPALDRPHRRQPAARHAEQHSGPEHAAAIQFRLRSREWSCAAQQPVLAAIRKLDNAAARR